MPSPLSIGRCAEIACILEATARKPGNVHPRASFADMTYDDLIRSAAAIAPVMERAVELGVGRTVLEAVRATRRVVAANTNLGMVLLLAPLAAVPRGRTLLPDPDGGLAVADLLRQTTPTDAEAVYEAMRLARPGGLGRVAEQDVWGVPTEALHEVMARAAKVDGIARQYTAGFQEVVGASPAALANEWDPARWEDCVINCFLRWASWFPDTLIARKCGPELAVEAGRRAGRLLTQRLAGSPEAALEFEVFDRWLRADGNRRNPGTSADLTAATLFVALREGIIAPPIGPVTG